MRAKNVLFRVLYWLAVLIISFAILIGLIMLLESRDSSSVGDHGPSQPSASISSTG